MQYRLLGKTGLKASVIGFGCNRIADPDADRKEVEATLEAALDNGINLFDTADSYSSGESERVLGRVFRSRRQEVLLCSKAGYRSWLRVALEQHVSLPGFLAAPRRSKKQTGTAHRDRRSNRNFAPRILSLAVESSLRRLQTDYLDFFYLHSPPPEIASAPHVFNTLKGLQQKGWIRHYGISFSDKATREQVLSCLPNPEISVLQFQIDPQESLKAQSIAASAAGAAIVGRQPFQRGAIFSSLQQLPDSSVRTPAQEILRSVLQQEGIHSVLVGMRSRKHLLENIGALQA